VKSNNRSDLLRAVADLIEIAIALERSKSPVDLRDCIQWQASGKSNARSGATTQPDLPPAFRTSDHHSSFGIESTSYDSAGTGA
jgi:hypothetical protein